jgi:hypothetical protein
MAPPPSRLKKKSVFQVPYTSVGLEVRTTAKSVEFKIRNYGLIPIVIKIAHVVQKCLKIQEMKQDV